MDLVEAEILREAGQYTAALRILTRALKKAPHNQDLLYARALTAVHVGQIEILEQDLKQIIAKDPNHVEALNALGYTLAAETNRYEEALSYIQRAFAIKPNNPAILDSMGWIQYRMGHPQKAVQYLKRALTLLQDPEIAAHLGEVLWQIGDQDQARRVWREALNKAPASEYILKMQELYGVRF
jgi:tetratricopeptide (TPR) repeat protein